MGQFGRPFKKCQTVKKLTSGGLSSMTTSAITSAAPLSKRGSSWTREVARFCCILGKYLSEEVVWVQIDPESLTRPSAPAMVGGRCQDDHQQGRVVELFSSEVSSLSSEVVVKIWRISKFLTLGWQIGCVGVLIEWDTSVNCSPCLEGGRHLPNLFNWVRDEPFLHQVLLWRWSSSSVKTTTAVSASATQAVVLLFCASLLLWLVALIWWSLPAQSLLPPECLADLSVSAGFSYLRRKWKYLGQNSPI